MLDLFRGIPRLGLATRGGTHLQVADIHHAIDRGIRFLNWCGTADALSQAIAELGPRRQNLMVCVQLEARTAHAASQELSSMLRELRSDYVDVVTLYYVETQSEWEEIIGPGGALAYCQQARDEGRIKLIGLTSHQRPLAARWAASGLLDLLMIRYNAAHRGAETEVFPITQARGMPVVAYTGLRWGALLKPTRTDPPGFHVPPAPAWYRFVLQHAAVTVALMAPDNRAELDENLLALNQPPLAEEEFHRLVEHGQRVRRSAGAFP